MAGVSNPPLLGAPPVVSKLLYASPSWSGYTNVEQFKEIIIIIIFLTLVKTRVGKKLGKVERGLKWKTSPGGPQRENRRAAIRR